MGPVQLAPVYHWYVYGRVPPDGLAVRVIDWPLSIVGVAGVTVPADNARFTPTVSPAEHAVADDESVTS